MSKTSPCPTCGFICPGDTVDNKHNCADLLSMSVYHLKEQLVDLTEEKELWRVLAGERGIENETLKAENKRLDMCLFSNTEPSQSYTGLEADLKEAEGAVADLMTLNDTLTGEMEALKKCDTTGYDRFEAGKSFANRLLKAENKTLRKKNDNWLERCEGLNTEVVEHQFHNDCHSGSDVCACSEKNGYPCYRHIDHEYRKLFSLNTAEIDRAEKAEAEVVLQSDDIKTLLSENNRKEQTLKKAEVEVERLAKELKSARDYIADIDF